MRVEMKVQITGTRNWHDWPAPGEHIDLPDAEAADLIATGVAIEAIAPAPQFAKTEVPEAATAPKATRRRKATE